jgi:lycopene beta-cyclase
MIEADYIFAGAGLSGLSLAYYILENDAEANIILIDKDQKTGNTHTWSYWEDTTNAFSHLAHVSYNTMLFEGETGNVLPLALKPYTYKSIRSADFYSFVWKKILSFKNVQFVNSNIHSINALEGIVETEKGDFQAKKYVFDSSFVPSFDQKKHPFLYQHFLGFEIETEKSIFSIEKAKLFDFSVPQVHDECHFVYVLPSSDKTALVEYTIFSDNLWEREQYSQALEKYLLQKLGLAPEKYRISETEYGIIPMSTQPLPMFNGTKVVKIGTSGGWVKASTGYSFWRCQQIAQVLAKGLFNSTNQKDLERYIHRKLPFFTSWKNWLDLVFLRVMLHKTIRMSLVFEALFLNNPTERMLAFLNNKTTFWQDIAIMNSVPLFPFLKEAFFSLLPSLSKK